METLFKGGWYVKAKGGTGIAIDGAERSKRGGIVWTNDRRLTVDLSTNIG